MIPSQELQDIMSSMRCMQPGDVINYKGVEVRRTKILQLWLVGLPDERPHSQHRRLITAAERVRRLLKKLRGRRSRFGNHTYEEEC